MSSELTDTLKPPKLYCYYDFYMQYSKDASSKYFYYNYYEFDPVLERSTEYILNLFKDNQLQLAFNRININDDSIIIPIVQRKDFPLTPPPPIRKQIKFLPPGDK